MESTTGFSPLGRLQSEDGKRLFLIVLSSFSIIAAGLLSRSGLSHLAALENSHEIQESSLRADSSSATHSTSQAPPVIARPASARRSAALPDARPESRFVRREIARYEDLLSTLSERAGQESSPAILERLNEQLSRLDSRVVQLRRSLSAFEASRPDRFTKETLRSDLFALQEEGKRAVDFFIDADNGVGTGTAQDLRLSRTGQ